MTLSKLHILIAMAIGVVTPTVTGLSAYYNAIGKIREDYVKKEELKDKLDKLDRIAEDVAEIKGSLRGLSKR